MPPRSWLAAWRPLPADDETASLPVDRLLARDLKLIKPKDYEELAQRTTEVKRMLTALMQKLNADR